MPGRLFIISNRLPVSVESVNGQTARRPSSGGLVSAVKAWLQHDTARQFSEVVWAGVPGCDEATWNGLPEGQEEFRYLPLFPEEQLYDDYYNGFSNSLIWPLFHYFPSFADYETSQFEAYVQANKAFADMLIPELRPDDLVWIHDYHLMPLAGMLRKRMQGLTIGFFLHIPFPSYELFRVIPKEWQRRILTGMLGADLIGFHTIEYASHFLSCIERVQKIEHDGRNIFWKHRQVQADAFPISIDFGQFYNAAEDPEVRAMMAQYAQMKGDRKLIFSVDRLDYTKGLSNRLKGYEEFLLKNPGYSGSVVFALTIIPSRDTIAKYAERKKMIDEFIGNLNSRLGNLHWQPVIYQYGHLSFQELAALYNISDLALITPLRDGMNLVAKEYVASRTDGSGVLVLSEMAGAAKELTEALLINPNDTSEMAEMIRYGLEMSPGEQMQRMRAMQDRVRQYDVVKWASDFFTQLKKVKDSQLEFEIRFIDQSSRFELIRMYGESGNRLILLDYDGTLVPFAKLPKEAAPAEDVLETLRLLSSSPQNEVYVISGRDGDTLESWLGDLPIGLIAEHGARIRRKDGIWEKALAMNSTGWKEKVQELMEHYVARCPNSFVEHKEFSLAWHYRNVSLAEGSFRAKELYEDLQSYLTGLPLQVLQGNKVIEVRTKGVNKGTAIDHVLKDGFHGFILCIGDDRTDEDMFRRLARIPEAFTIKVGNEASFAKYNLHNPAMVHALLRHLGHLKTAGSHRSDSFTQ